MKVNLLEGNLVLVEESLRLPVRIKELSDAIASFSPESFKSPIVTCPRMPIENLLV